jgi:sulfite reductase (NADPH) flavoprotein alpha-component
MESDLFDEYDVQEFLLAFGLVDLSSQDLVDTLAPLRPRLYSIASSQAAFPREVHLTVGRVENEVRGRNRKGVASTMFADRLDPGASLRVFVQPNHGFTIPADPTAAAIMVGPGTGIAPFMAFLQQRELERRQQNNGGANWLFFGDQTRESDFLYEQQLTKWLETGLLNRLDLAFSRDSDQKIYVQHRMQQQGAELYRWLESGSYFYLCGDAQRMARDVESALLDIIVTHGNHSPAGAKDYLKALRQSGRYAADVY